MSGFEYSIITEIKKSDKSNVYLASVTGHEYPVIVKEIQHGNIQVFEALKEIDSEYLPKIYHVEKIEDGLLVVEEYVDGELLADHLVLREITEAECIDIAVQICSALEVLHNHKPAIIHRDVKPSNIIVVPNGKVKLIDYDSSRLYKEESESDTRFLGTENYAAPEQFGYSQTDCRSDIYSLGVVLRRFKEFLKPTVIKKWEKIVEKCTLFSPDSRYQSVTEVKRKIEKIRKRGWIKCNVGIAVSLMFIAMIVPVIIYVFAQKDNQSTTLLQSTTSTIERLTTEISTKETTTTVEPPTTELETTKAPTTEVPTTIPTIAPTEDPTSRPTEGPTTEAPTIEKPIMEPLTTEIPTTEQETTEEMTTEAPTTEAPTTKEPTTEPPTTKTSTIDATTVEETDSVYIAPPEYRDVMGEDRGTVLLKYKIRENSNMVAYYYREVIQGRDFYIQKLKSENDSIVGIKLEAAKNGNIYTVNESDYDKTNNIIIISNRFMESIENGWYTMNVEMRTFEGGKYEVIIYVYVAENDEYDQSYYPFQYSNFSYWYEYDIDIYVVLKNDVDEKILSVMSGDKVAVDNSMYEILYDGRVLKLSSELFDAYLKGGFYAQCTNGDKYINITRW